MVEQQTLNLQTSGRSLTNITHHINDILRGSELTRGLCHVFLKHTSASLVMTENADSNVLRDLENYMARLVTDGDPAYFHDQEGADDMAAHIRSVLTQTEVTMPIVSGRLDLGTWQGLFLWEHRYREHNRQLIITLSGD